MVKLLNRASVTTATVGTGTITLGAAKEGFQTFAEAGANEGDVIVYAVEDNGAWEIGEGTYSSGTLTRNVSYSSLGGSPISLSGTADVFATVRASDFGGPGNGDLQPTVETITDATGSVTLDLDTANWFNISPSDDVTVTFGLDNQAEGKFDLVWENVETEPVVNSQYDLANASYDNVSISVVGQDSRPTDIHLSPDGTKMYIVGQTTETTYQYTLGSAFDLSSATYDNLSFDSSAQDINPQGVRLAPDGSRMFVFFYNNACQYSLSSAFDISTASYDGVSFDYSSQENFARAASFNDDGTKVYVVGSTSSTVFQYSLAAAYDLSSASYDNVSFSVAGQSPSPYGLTFNTDGTKMFIADYGSDVIFQYSLSSSFDLSSTTYDNVSFSVSAQDSQAQGVAFNGNGTKMYIAGSGGDNVYQYTTGSVTPGEKATLTFTDTIEWESGSAPTFSADGEKDWFYFEKTDGTSWQGKVKDQGFT